MAIGNLLFGRQAKKIGDIEIDVTLHEKHEFTSEVTEFPIEDGSVISDHVITRPEKVSITGFITNTPISFFSAVGNLITGSTPVADAYGKLREIHSTREPVTLVTGLFVYTNMILERLTIPRDRTSGDAIRFTAEFKNIVKVTSESVNIPADQLAASALDAGAAAGDLGRQTGSPVADGPRSSILATIFGVGN